MALSREFIGLVIKATGSWYTVVNRETAETIECKIRGKIRLKDVKTTNPVVVGDLVNVEVVEGDDVGVISKIVDRKNYIIRRSSNLSKEAHIIAANIDQVFLVVTIDLPKTSREFVDRFLVAAEAYKIPTTIVVNKIDLYDIDARVELELFKMDYALAGYEVLEVSALREDNLDLLGSRLSGKISVFSGNSGVGKSTLLNALLPDLDLKTGKISDYHHKGTHTTTFSEMFGFNNDGYIIDTPGIKGFGIVDVKKDELFHFFKDLFKYAEGCKFYNCTHTHEPGCAVKEAVTNEKIAFSRYESYLKILDDEGEKYRAKM
ncbi:ribosome small subunit-dependent GTPase A [Alistipes sp. ZOR0009]|uniref:ribosome small subunit-dependent GTPase A n=1 Tax=Alistipes sp. ZOR0009 TaxID=1339253 RepID=UPI000646FE69|nr:ribosome small subunit-dependent GTPase A [Alistipes sp. ZOR0009]